jgi:ubiquinone biosynthesis protein UbiJ
VRVSYFADAEEVDCYIGGIFREADEHPEVGPKLRAANLVLKLACTDPTSQLTIRLADPHIEVVSGADGAAADIELRLPADVTDRFWRGDYNLAIGLAKGEVTAKGSVNKILELVPLTEPLYPIYEQLVAEKDANAAVA